MTRTHRPSLTWLALSGAACSTTPFLQSCQPKESEEPNKPCNIVYIMTDDHTAQMMSCYDTRYIETPNLDRIARDGVRFTNSFVANSISGPSRACMLTGKHSHANGFTNNEHSIFDGSQMTFPKLLQQAGYETAIIGKWHLHSLPTGFDHWEILPGQGDYYNPDFINMQADTVRQEGYVTNLITEKSLQWLEQRTDKSRPFCLLIHHKAIHRNWLPELKYLREYENTTFQVPETFNDDYSGRPAAAAQEMSIVKDMDMIYDIKMLKPGVQTRLRELYMSMIDRLTPQERHEYDAFYDSLSTVYYSRHLSQEELADWKFQRYMRDYSKVVKSLDDNVGKVLDYLKEHNMLDNTLVVYTSDQGFYMGEHGWFDKRFMYEESMHTPLIMLLPKGLERRGDITDLVQNIDYAPTFLDLAGIPIPQEMHGMSLLPLLRSAEDPETPLRTSLYYHYYEYPAEHSVKRHYGIRTERYKLIHFYNDIDVWELYDLYDDPAELHNLYGKPDTEEITRELMKGLISLEKQYADTLALGMTIPVAQKMGIEE